jgi:predicted alpha/beta-hydrolase family hydrolase
MALWDKLKTELDRAGKAAQGALDEGKTRLEAFRARQLADKAAQALGYAVFRAKQAGTDVDWQTLQRLVTALAERETEIARLEKELAESDKKAETTTPPPESGTSGTT